VAKKQKCPEFENHERWLVSYADKVTLLFAVFVTLYALNQADAKKAEQMASSVQDSFNTPMEDIPMERRVGPTEAGFGIFEHFRGDQIRPPLSQKFPGSQSQIKVIDDEMTKIRMQIEDRLYGPNKHRDDKKPGHERVVDVQRTRDGFKLRMLAQHFFEPGATVVRRQALPELDQVVKLLKELGRPVTIEGHTDSVPPSGNSSNWDISAMRATNVLKYMIGKHTFPVSKISAAGYADVRPIAHNGTESGRALNRRIEIHVNYEPSNTMDPQ